MFCFWNEGYRNRPRPEHEEATFEVYPQKAADTYIGKVDFVINTLLIPLKRIVYLI